MKKTIAAILLTIVIVAQGCSKEFPVQPRANQPPKTFLWLFPDSAIAPGVSKQKIRWWGEDPDGVVVGYLFAVDSIGPPVAGIPTPDTLRWSWTSKNDTLMAFPLRESTGVFTVFVRAVDNTIEMLPPEASQIRFTHSPYWDKNNNNVFDEGDQLLPSLVGAVDPMGANQWMPLRNTPPEIKFARDPNDPTRVLQQPETTYTAASFAWIGTDFDGDETIIEYRIALNDTSQWVTLPGHATFVSLFVPRARSEAATGVVDADVYTGSFLNRQHIRTLPGLKLDSLNVFYVQAKDIAGEYSQVISMPELGKRWFVKKPRGRMLVVEDYIKPDSLDARELYRSTLSQVTLPTGSLGDYSVLNIGRGISATDKQNSAAGIASPRFGVLVPPFIDPAFIYTLFLFDYVFWYTEEFPSLTVAQFSLFHYKNTVFDGRRGRVIFSTSFGTNPDPRSVLRDFAPIDSVSSVDLSATRKLPSLGDTRIPGDFQVIPDSSPGASIYPPLAFNTGRIHSVFMRPVYRQPDGRSIYRMQEDSRVPIRYTFLATQVELRSVSLMGSTAHAVGNEGVVLTSSDAGESWTRKESGVERALRSVYLLDANRGWAVGDSGTLITTSNGGASWTNRSLITIQNFHDVQFVTPQTGIIVGTRGLLIRSTDGGASWSEGPTGTSRTLRAIEYVDANHVVVVGDTGLILKSIDGGATWTSKPSGTLRALRGVSAVPGTETIFAVGDNGAVVRSTDRGDTWSSQTSFTGRQLRSIRFANQTVGFAVGADGSVFRTNTGGTTWTSLSSGTNHTLNDLVASPDGLQCVTTGSGGIILKSTNGGESWSFQPRGSIHVGVIDGQKRFVFLGLPLHLLNGLNTVRDFFQHVFTEEFRP